MDDQNFLEELLERNNFVVKVYEENTNELKVDYASMKEEKYEIFPLEPATGEIVVFINNEKITLPNYIVRLYVLCHIFFQCRKLKLSYNIVKFFNKDNEKTTLIKLFPFEFSEEEAAMEIQLNEITLEILKDNTKVHIFDDLLVKTGMLQTFNLLKGLLI